MLFKSLRRQSFQWVLLILDRLRGTNALVLAVLHLLAFTIRFSDKVKSLTSLGYNPVPFCSTL